MATHFYLFYKNFKTNIQICTCLIQKGLRQPGDCLYKDELYFFASSAERFYVQAKTSNLLLANIAFANLLVSFLVKPISAIYLSYALSTGRWQVHLPTNSFLSLTF